MFQHESGMERIFADRWNEVTHPGSDGVGQMAVGEVSLDELFSPRGVAVVGASGAEKLTFAELVIHALKEAEFPAIYPVNPKYTEVLGLRCYPDLLSIPGVVDHVVVNIPAERLPSL